MRRLLADTFAMLVFSPACGLFIEVVIAGLGVEQSLRVRLSALPVILFSGRPYGLYRDWLFRRFGGAARPLRPMLLDMFATTSFQGGLYAALLVLNGVHGREAAKAFLAVIALSLVVGRPYGLFLGWIRILFRTPPSA